MGAQGGQGIRGQGGEGSRTLGGILGLGRLVTSASKAKGEAEGGVGRGAARRTLDDSLLSARFPFSSNTVHMSRWVLMAFGFHH